jgi:hypothetical protein
MAVRGATSANSPCTMPNPRPVCAHQLLCTQNPMELFVTVFYSSSRKRRLYYANGGHSPPYGGAPTVPSRY